MILRVRVYTGPSLVPLIAEKLSEAGYTITLEGTAHVYLESEDTESILRVLGPTWKPRDLTVLGTV